MSILGEMSNNWNDVTAMQLPFDVSTPPNYNKWQLLPVVYFTLRDNIARGALSLNNYIICIILAILRYTLEVILTRTDSTVYDEDLK